MSAHRRALADLDVLTTQLRDRTDAWARQLRLVERVDRENGARCAAISARRFDL